MKVYECPLEAPSLVETNGAYDSKAYNQREQEFMRALKARLVALGFTGKLTGTEFSIPWADGAARYMVAQEPRTVVLIHLPLGDAWNVPEYMTRGLRKADILRQAQRRPLFGNVVRS